MLKTVNKPLLLGLLLLGLTGCQAMGTLAYVFFPNDARLQPPITLCEGRKDKKKIAVLAYARNDLRWQFDDVGRDLNRELIREISQRDERLQVVDFQKIRSWQDNNADWAAVDLAKVGEEFDCDYVMWVEIQSLNLHETRNQWLLKGRASVTLRVYDVNKGEVMDEQDFEEEYPKNRPIPTSEMASDDQFKRLLIRELAKHLSWFVTPHAREEDFQN